MGIFAGYLMFKTPKWRTNSFVAVMGWVIALVTQWAIIYGELQLVVLESVEIHFTRRIPFHCTLDIS